MIPHCFSIVTVVLDFLFPDTKRVFVTDTNDFYKIIYCISEKSFMSEKTAGRLINPNNQKKNSLVFV